ncbi:MAG: hypothetical protein SGJ27_08175 [Candidatus Melainabacteria bacterium]|nr:hypothetical protein [Candidatus Melainabacteria bacterium]
MSELFDARKTPGTAAKENGADHGDHPQALTEQALKALSVEFAMRQQFHKADRADPNALDLLGEVGYSALYQGAQSPVISLGQIGDNLLSKAEIKTNIAEFVSVFPAPEHEDFGTARWHAQQIGAGIGMILPFVATKSALSKSGLSFAARTEASVYASSKLASAANAGLIADGALTGFAYDFFLRPVEQKDAGRFWTARGEHGLAGAATFGTLTAGSVGLRHASRSLAASLVNAPRGARVSYDVAMGALPGIPAGIVSADVSARLSDRRWATSDERKQSAYAMFMLGGSLSALHAIPGSDVPLGDIAREFQSRKTATENLNSMLAERARSVKVETPAAEGSNTVPEAVRLTGRGGNEQSSRIVAGGSHKPGQPIGSIDVEKVAQPTDVQLTVKSYWQVRQLERKAAIDEATVGLETADRKLVAENLLSSDAAEVRQSLAGKDLVACARAWKHCPFMEPTIAQELGTYLAKVEPPMQKVLADHINASLFFSGERIAAYLAELPKHDLTSCANVWRNNPRISAPAAEKLGRHLESIPKESHAAVCDYCSGRTWEIDRLTALPPATLEAVAQCSPHMKHCTPLMASELWPRIKDISPAARELVCKHLEASFSSNVETLKGVNLESCITAWEHNIRLSPDAASALHPLVEGLAPEAKQLVCKYVAAFSLDAPRVQELLGGRNLADCAIVWENNPYMQPLAAERFAEVARHMEPEQRKAAADYLGSSGYGLDRVLPVWRLNAKVSGEAASALSYVFESQSLTEPAKKAVCDYVAEQNLKSNSVPVLHLEDCALVWQHNPRVHPHDAAALGRFIDNLPPDVQRAVCDRAAHLGHQDINTLKGIDTTAAAAVWALGEFDVPPALAARIGPEISRIAPAERGGAIKPVLQWIDHLERRYGGQELLDKVSERLQGRDLEACAKVWTIDPTMRPSLAEKLAAVIGDIQNPDSAFAVCKYAKDSGMQSREVAERFAGRNLDACAKAWKHAPELPPSIAEQFANYSAREKVAATVAWDELNRSGISPDKAAGEFQPVLDRYMKISPKDLHEKFVESGSASLYLLLDSMRGPRPGREAVSLTATEIDALHNVLSAETKRASRRSDTADGAEHNAVDPRRAYYEAALALNVNVFRDVLVALNSSTHYGGGIHWQTTSAAKLALTFNKDSRAWLERCAKIGLDAHDATYWLPADANAGTNGLRQFLNQNLRNGSTPAHQQQMLSDIRLLTKDWNNLSQPEREGLLSGTAAMGDVAMEVKARTRYPGTKNLAFAVESASWGTSRSEYKEYEGRFIKSQNTPSPFPLEKSWTDGNLTGRFLPRNDTRGVYLGEHSNCCQHPADAGAACAWYGQESPRSGFFVVENKAGEVVAQSWAWISENGQLCFDSIESKGLGTRESAVVKIYQEASTDLAKKHQTVTVGSSKVNLNHLPKAGEKTAKLPKDYRRDPEHYSDAANQKILADSP